MLSVQSSSFTQSCPTFCDSINHSMPGLPVHHQLPEFTQTHVHQVGDPIQPFHPLSSPSPPAPNPQHQSFSNELPLHMRWSKYWSFSFSISPSNEHQGLISFRMDGWTPCSPRDSQESSLAPRRSLACCYCVMLFLAVYLCEPYIILRVLSLLLLQLSLLVPSDQPFALLFPNHYLEKSLSIFPLCFSRSSPLNLSSAFFFESFSRNISFLHSVLS